MTIKKILLSGALVAGLVTLVACGDKSPDQAGGAPSAQQAAAASSLLARVPADTPYLFLNTQGMSDELYDSYIQQYVGMFDAMSSMFENIELGEKEDNAEAEAVFGFVQRFYTVMADVDNSASLRDTTGLSPEGLGVFYGAGVFPVMIVETTDPAKTNAVITSLLSDDASNSSIQQMPVESVSVNKLAFADDQIAVYWNIDNNLLSLALLPIQLEDDYLSGIFGDARPANAVNIAQVTAMNRDYGFSGYGSGYVDMVRIYDQLVNPDTPEGATVATMLEGDSESFLNEPACIAETRALLNKAPRMYSGVTELTADKVGARVIVTMDDNLRTGLASVVGNAPIGNDPKTPMNFGMNLNLAGLRDFVSEQTSSVLQAPFTCSHLASLNEASQQMNAGVNQPMLPLIGTINGLRVSLANLNLDGLEEADPEQIAQNVKGHVVVYSEQPSMLIGLGQMTLPFLAGMDLEPGGEPQLLDSSMVPIDIGPTYLATSDSGIGLSVGDGQQDGLSDLLNAQADAEPILFSFGMDYKLYAQFLAFAESQDDDAGAGDDDSDPEAAAERARTKAMMQQMQAIYENMGYTFSDVLINDQGMVMNQVLYRKQ